MAPSSPSRPPSTRHRSQVTSLSLCSYRCTVLALQLFPVKVRPLTASPPPAPHTPSSPSQPPTPKPSSMSFWHHGHGCHAAGADLHLPCSKLAEENPLTPSFSPCTRFHVWWSELPSSKLQRAWSDPMHDGRAQGTRCSYMHVSPPVSFLPGPQNTQELVVFRC